jgi:hypothetical protein
LFGREEKEDEGDLRVLVHRAEASAHGTSMGRGMRERRKELGKRRG